MRDHASKKFTWRHVTEKIYVNADQISGSHKNTFITYSLEKTKVAIVVLIGEKKLKGDVYISGLRTQVGYRFFVATLQE